MKLQWGHDEGGFVECNGRPPKDRSGHRVFHASALQWGHDEGVVEELLDFAGRPKAPSRSYKLQWGHDEGVVEEDSEAL